MLKHKLVLGTVQLGLNYGINNKQGMPSHSEAISILQYACDQGLRAVDTANAYGKSQAIIGDFCQGEQKFDIYSKFSSVDGDPVASLRKAVGELKVPRIRSYSFHSFQDFLQARPTLGQEIRDSGLVDLVGVSLYTDEELAQVVDNENIDVIQVPFNLLDCSLRKRELMSIARSNGKLIHVRSIFLQGLFFKNRDSFPDKLLPLVDALNELDEIAAKHRVSLHKMCIMTPLMVPDIDGVIVGVESLAQFSKNIEMLDEDTIAEELINDVFNLKCRTPELLNPVNW